VRIIAVMRQSVITRHLRVLTPPGARLPRPKLLPVTSDSACMALPCEDLLCR
jgi:hypothetical protein